MKYNRNIMAVLSLLLLMIYQGFGQKKSGIFNPNSLQISWKVTQNAFEGKRQYWSVFTIKNLSKQALPKSGWSLYFNYIRDIDPSTISSDINIEHLNGDIFRLSPKANFAGLEAGKSLEVSFLSSEIFVNIADAPFGLYWVNDSQLDKGITIENYKVEPPNEDKVGYLTPSQLYEKNT